MAKTSSPDTALMANAVRALAMDAVQQANSGHPGAPMGMAEMAVALWGRHLPGLLSHDRIRYGNLIDVVFFTSDGALGIPVTTAARYAWRSEARRCRPTLPDVSQARRASGGARTDRRSNRRGDHDPSARGHPSP